MYTFSFIVGNIIPKSVKCIHSAAKSDFEKSLQPKANSDSSYWWRAVVPVVILLRENNYEVPRLVQDGFDKNGE